MYSIYRSLDIRPPHNRDTGFPKQDDLSNEEPPEQSPKTFPPMFPEPELDFRK